MIEAFHQDCLLRVPGNSKSAPIETALSQYPLLYFLLDEEYEMKNLKSATMFAATAAALALSASAFAGPMADYNSSMSAAKSDYKSSMAACKEKSGDDRHSCMKDAKDTEKAAFANAKATRRAAMASNSKQGHLMENNEGAKN